MDKWSDVAEGMLPLTLGVTIALAVAACGAAPPKQANDESSFSSSGGSSAPSDVGGGSSGAASEGGGGLNEEQKKQMEIALRRGGEKAANCAEVVPDAPRGEGEVEVVFDGQKGRVIEVTMGAPFAGTSAEACIKRAFVGEIVLPFAGDPKSVPYTIKLPEKKGAAPEKAEKAEKKK